MDKFQAKFTHTTAGWDGGEQGRKYLVPGEFYDVDYIEIHSMHTRIYLKGYSEWFNSVYFDYYQSGGLVPREKFWNLVRDFGYSNIDEWENLE